MSTPSESEQLMTFDLQAYSLDQGQSEFEALSYTWDHPVCDDFKDDLLHTNGHYQARLKSANLGLILDWCLGY
jgi:hypothetical protein